METNAHFQTQPYYLRGFFSLCTNVKYFINPLTVSKHFLSED